MSPPGPAGLSCRVLSRGRPEQAIIGQMWAICFRRARRRGTHQAVGSDAPDAVRALDVGSVSPLTEARAVGTASNGTAVDAWTLAYQELAAFVSRCRAVHAARAFPGRGPDQRTGGLRQDLARINGQRVRIDGWRGSQNHQQGTSIPTDTRGDRWPVRQPARRVPGHSTAKLRIGPVWTPWLATWAPRVQGASSPEFDNKACATDAAYRCFEWHIVARSGPVSVEVRFTVNASAWSAGLTATRRPSACLNTKLAAITGAGQRRQPALIDLHAANSAHSGLLWSLSSGVWLREPSTAWNDVAALSIDTGIGSIKRSKPHGPCPDRDQRVKTSSYDVAEHLRTPENGRVYRRLAGRGTWCPAYSRHNCPKLPRA